MKHAFSAAIAALCFIALLMPAQAKPVKTGKVQQAQKERLVLMPLRLDEADQNLQGAMETALVKGLQQKYEVFSGEQVAKKAREIFMKESRNSSHKECDETRCLQGIAEAFQAELLATANITKQDGGYFIALSIQNLFDNKVVQSESVACEGCNAFKVIDKLKELVGTPVAVQTAEEPQIKVNLNDPEGALWAEVEKGNTVDDYSAYLEQYRKGKYVVLAKVRIKKLQEQAAAELIQQDQSAWEAANSAATEAGYQDYLKLYPQGRYAGLVQARIKKIQSEQLAASRKAEAEMSPGRVFKDCSECPELVILPPGGFDMGADDAVDNEKPVHHVSISRKFALGKTEVTRGQFAAFVAATGYDAGNECYVLNGNQWEKRSGNWRDPGYQQDDSHPVSCINWNDAKAYAEWLSRKTGQSYLLPTESQWEYACRAGSHNKYCGNDNEDNVAWYGKKGGDSTHPVAQKQANAWGLYDMSGNVWEWTEDSFHDNYNGAPVDGTAWTGDASKRVIRGGSWLLTANYLRASGRVSIVNPSIRDYGNGFRVVRALP
jgi:formylglycine-generating enzyme required for sulfatase activity